MFICYVLTVHNETAVIATSLQVLILRTKAGMSNLFTKNEHASKVSKVNSGTAKCQKVT